MRPEDSPHQPRTRLYVEFGEPRILNVECLNSRSSGCEGDYDRFFGKTLEDSLNFHFNLIDDDVARRYRSYFNSKHINGSSYDISKNFIFCIPASKKNDKEIVMEVVEGDGTVLKQASDDLRKDRKIIKKQ